MAFRVLSPLYVGGDVGDVVEPGDGVNVRALVRSRILEPVPARAKRSRQRVDDDVVVEEGDD